MPCRYRWACALAAALVLVVAAVARDVGGAADAGGLIRVQIVPAAAAKAGAAAVIDMGAERYADGALVRGLAMGRHGVHFTTIDGFPTPPDQRVSIGNTLEQLVVGKYVPNTGHGALRVTLTPDAAKRGARWTIDTEAAAHAGGETLARLAAGEHTVHFGALAGFVTPADEQVTICADEQVEVAANYVAADGTGDLRLTLSPAAALAAGAAWRVDDGPTTQTSGAIVAGLAPGEHTVSFTTVADFATPAVMTVQVTAGQTASAEAAYTSSAAISFAAVVRPLAQAGCRCHGSTMTTLSKLLAARYVVPGHAEASLILTQKAMQPRWGADRQKVVDWVNGGANP